MHGLINCALERFVRDTYGSPIWADVIRASNIEIDTFEAMLSYKNNITFQILTALSQTLEKPPGEVLEDIGMYLVSHSNNEALRRLMRFSGVTFEDFLYSLDDLHDRARLAVPDLTLPDLELLEEVGGQFELLVRANMPGIGFVLMGVLRAMADDYGALVFLEHKGNVANCEKLSISLLENSFSEGREFHLGRAVGE
ncbi:heme NO-binding domain-containing protein [Parasulfitobacter algicola]|uniref:Heme NO-binding domain-containing protein n=1 Tax=Parasulfitobacter algicola TaxID=2614809 RepID=A0ABX2IP14_9RHOB|nr:heme NO-binding domain-containing protein [Sulfitobacter algicola]NSX54632.1 heme NO-binding domain-containing protein [Sulfitobacter algicola]